MKMTHMHLHGIQQELFIAIRNIIVSTNKFVSLGHFHVAFDRMNIRGK